MGMERTEYSSFVELTVNNRLNILSPYTIQNGIVSASLGLSVEIECDGSGNLTWVSSSGEVDKSDVPNPPLNLFQERNPRTNVLALVIRTFRSSNIGRYACRIEMYGRRRVFEAPVYISDGKNTVIWEGIVSLKSYSWILTTVYVAVILSINLLIILI
jgi:hypothetical protein